MPDPDDLRSDLKSERIQLGSPRIQRTLEILEGWVLEGAAGDEDAEASETGVDDGTASSEDPDASALSKAYILTSPRAAMAFANYVAQVAEDLECQPTLVTQGSVVEVRSCTEFEDGGLGVAEADLELALAIDSIG